MSPGARAHLGDGDYVTDVAYARTFVDHLAPSALRLVAALNGVTPPPGDDFDYCELGSGNGDTLAALAAANPRGRFVGVDFNPEHVAFASALAKRGGLDNVRFLARDFEDLAGESLPTFDYIAMHGVISWVGPAKRAAVFDFARARLKPGGLLYVSYNARPGWNAVEPLRRLMLEHTAGMKGTTLDRAREGLRFAQALCDAGSVYFDSHPTAKSMLALMQKAGLPYVVHEYFHQHWHPMYFAEVARALADKNLRFVGQFPLYFAFRDLALPRKLAAAAGAFGEGDEDRIAFESLKDFALNEFFRSDVYTKPPADSSAATSAYLETTPFGTLVPASLVRREVRLPHFTVQLTGPLYDALIPEIASGAASAIELAMRPALAELGVTRIADAMKTMALGGQLVPMRATRPPVPRTFNQAVVANAVTRDNPLVLASPTTGNGIAMSMLDAVCVRLLTEVAPADRAAWIRALVEQQPVRLVVGDRAIKDRDELARTITEAFARFSAVWSDKLVELGILDDVCT